MIYVVVSGDGVYGPFPNRGEALAVALNTGGRVKPLADPPAVTAPYVTGDETP